MNHRISRRGFLKSCIHTSLALTGLSATGRIQPAAAEVFKRSGSPRLLTSLAAYSFREFFVDGNNRRPANADSRKRIDMFQFVDYCADLGCQGTEPTSYYFPENVTDDYLLRLKRHAFLRGVAVSGTAVGNNFTLPKGERRDREIAAVRKWIDRAAVLGAPHIRIFAGATSGQAKEEGKRLCVEALEECCDYAGSKGIFLGLENHGGIVAEAGDLLEIVKAVKSPWLGVNLDTGNFHTDDPYGDLAKCAPYSVNVQVKVEMQRRGGKKEEADFQRIIKILCDVNYQGFVALEYEAAEDPWTAVPRYVKRLKETIGA